MVRARFDNTQNHIRNSSAASAYPVVTVLGPRQSGKITLVQMTFPVKPYVFLEEPDICMAAEQDPRGGSWPISL